MAVRRSKFPQKTAFSKALTLRGVTPGVASFALRPSEAGKSLAPLLGYARKILAKDVQSENQAILT